MDEKEFTLEWEDEEICQVYRNGDCMGTDEVVDLLNEKSEENEKLKLKLHVWEQVAYMLDIEVNRAMEDGFEISEWYKNHLAKGPVIL